MKTRSLIRGRSRLRGVFVEKKDAVQEYPVRRRVIIHIFFLTATKCLSSFKMLSCLYDLQCNYHMWRREIWGPLTTLTLGNVTVCPVHHWYDSRSKGSSVLPLMSQLQVVILPYRPSHVWATLSRLLLYHGSTASELAQLGMPWHKSMALFLFGFNI